MKEDALSNINQYYDRLNKIVAVRFDVYDDDRYYYDMLCSDPTLEDEVKAFYFNHEILIPLKEVLDCVVKEGHISVDGSILTNEFRLSVGSMVDILKSISPKCRRMMLERIKCPSGAYSDLESGFMLVDADALQRATDKVDLTDDFKRISFLWTLAFSDVRAKNLSAASIDEKFFDVLLLANNRNFDEEFQDVLSASLQIEGDSADIVFTIAKRLIKDCYWDNIDCFTSKEQSIINEILASRLFASFVRECRKEFKKDHPKAVFSEEVLVDKSSKKKTNDMLVNVIMGVRGLAKFVGVGVTKAQEIVNSKILEEKGISYWVGRKICDL